MNLVSIPSGKISISFPDTQITVNGVIYNNLVFIGRLLSGQEVARIESFSVYQELSNLLIEEDIFDMCIESVVGADEDILASDIEEAGIVSSISGAILSKSKEHFTSSESLLNSYYLQVQEYEQICAIVSRFLNISYEEIISMPVNDVFKRFAIVQNTFRSEVAIILGEISGAESE